MDIIPAAVVLLFDAHKVADATFWAHQLPWGQIVQFPIDP
jgi:hypothetical protein